MSGVLNLLASSFTGTLFTLTSSTRFITTSDTYKGYGDDTSVGGGTTFGSASPSTMGPGKTLIALADNFSDVSFVTFVQTIVQISGFSTNPGQSWLSYVSNGSAIRLGSSASSYAYGGGVATWRWTSAGGFTAMGFTPSGTFTCIMAHP